MNGITLSDGEGGTTTIPLHWAAVRYWLDPERGHVHQLGYPPGFVGYEVWDAEAGVLARFKAVGRSATDVDGQMELMRAMVDSLNAGGERRAQALAAAR